MNSRAKRVRVRGPLGPYSEGFRTELAARGDMSRVPRLVSFR
jgi:hypothetical protein